MVRSRAAGWIAPHRRCPRLAEAAGATWRAAVAGGGTDQPAPAPYSRRPTSHSPDRGRSGLPGTGPEKEHRARNATQADIRGGDVRHADGRLRHCLRGPDRRGPRAGPVRRLDPPGRGCSRRPGRRAGREPDRRLQVLRRRGQLELGRRGRRHSQGQEGRQEGRVRPPPGHRCRPRQPRRCDRPGRRGQADGPVPRRPGRRVRRDGLPCLRHGHPERHRVRQAVGPLRAHRRHERPGRLGQDHRHRRHRRRDRHRLRGALRRRPEHRRRLRLHLRLHRRPRRQRPRQQPG